MRWSTEPSVVALGGGHGLAVSLTALRGVTTDLTAVVTVADNGGSSGRLRDEFGVLPPGDLRMALAALCGDDRWGQTWARVLQHRFASEGEMDGHSMGNLLIVTLWDLLHDHVDGLDWVAGLLGARGRVLPMALTPLDITAEVQGSGRRPRRGRHRPRPGRGRDHGRRGALRRPRPRGRRGLPAGDRGHRRGRLGRPRARVLVLQRHPAPAGARPARRPVPYAGQGGRLDEPRAAHSTRPGATTSPTTSTYSSGTPLTWPSTPSSSTRRRSTTATVSGPPSRPPEHVW